MPLSSLHSKLATPLPLPSLPLKLNVALVLLLGLPGWLVIVVSGASISTTQVKLAGAPSTLPTLSIARTWKVCEPAAKPV